MVAEAMTTGGARKEGKEAEEGVEMVEGVVVARSTLPEDLCRGPMERM